ncbi:MULTISPECIES: hypothetical protein [Streptomyces]|uniref:hypothetical protein n=1 Tax=Streptomyces TaxID=1883 RepID=UPI00226EF22F|nr:MULTISPECIES: hypothetical protein [unclassified Streptomyces]MCY0921687.1 hypothetical protein [Streptomyces sp. H27-G5]MCY0944020.1 hypothetical protein [Streptomyces sp. H34-AA3]MCY0956260.1 hypothetical protein [Streptomyces sp. H27-H5]MCZ4082280.1 hypothetical protein [Streptomyces sp. H34-S5]
MKKLVKFTLARTTHGDVELEIDVPDEFLDDDGEIYDDAGLCDWINDNEPVDELDPTYEEIQTSAVLRLVNGC